MQFPIKELDALYDRYGFLQREYSPDVRVYYYRKAYFHGAEIVPLSPTALVDEAEREYRNSGYAVHVRHYDTLEEAQNNLFNGFFHVEETAVRLAEYYKSFCDRRKRILGAPYEYVTCPYSVDGALETRESDLVPFVLNALSRTGPQLIIVEAAAGFGKTCTAYEVLHAMLHAGAPRSPIFTELSRNRQARVFRHVLLDEIDRHYHGLNSDLVLSEISSGRLPVVIDGFDELLGKHATIEKIDQQEFKEVENMLDTVSDLLQGEAKIILTTRRTAIFAGDEFALWQRSKSSSFGVTRIALHEPSVDHWLSPDRVALLRERGFIDQVSNPVMLSFLRHLEINKFRKVCSNADTIVEHYFMSLLEREQDRQALLMPPEKQLKVFSRLAKDMVEFDITSETRDFVLQLILESNAELIEEARKLYGPTERPSAEEIANKLASHALLDRLGENESSIGFINKFVFGTLIADSALDDEKAKWFGSETMFDMAVTAFKMRSNEVRLKLWEKLNFFASSYLTPTAQLSFDLDLKKSPSHALGEATIESLTFSNCIVGADQIVDSIFVGCTFRNIQFDLSGMQNVGFLTCRFYNCTTNESELPADAIWKIWDKGCEEAGGSVLKAFYTPNIEPVRVSDENIERELLKVFWPSTKKPGPVGSATSDAISRFCAREI